MDTKLKSFNRSNMTKLVAFLLVVAMVTGLVGISIFTYFSGISPEVLLTKEYKSSEAYNNDLVRTLWDIEGMLSGEEIGIDDGVVFFGTNDENTISQPFHMTETIIKNSRTEYFMLKDGYLVGNGQEDNMMVSRYSGNPSNKVIFSFSDKYMEDKQEQWTLGRVSLMPKAIAFIAFIAAIIILVAFLMIQTGKKAEDDTIHLAPIDKIYTEILVAAVPLAVALFAVVVSSLFSNLDYPEVWRTNLVMSSRQAFALYASCGAAALSSVVLGLVILSASRRVKAGVFWKTSLIYRASRSSIVFFRSFLDGSRMERFPLTKKLHKRQIIFIGASFFLVFLTFLFLSAPPLIIVPPILEIILIYWYFKYNKETFDEINKGFDDSLEDQMKAEQMKVNLVTNVSHDLKTPLTSIISYVDLLKREEGLSDNAREYVEILSEKSNRLKGIVSDLFELAKSTSGDIKVDFEKLDLKKLLEQTLGDMDDAIEASSITVKSAYPDEPVEIVSDGNKLYRVLQNIMDNALKYSMKGTRVFVSLDRSVNEAVVTVKNTASYEMNFSEEEILQRFYRGEESRTGEGSGLGLSIAESFTRNCGGRFNIEIDGDQFRVRLMFPLG